MRTWLRTLVHACVPALVLVSMPRPAAACDLLASYMARLGDRDHYNSRGQRLTTPAAILRQDRANFHRFGVRDPEDQSDTLFATMEGRARMEAVLNNMVMSPETWSEIVNGTPLIMVRICQDRIEVYKAYQQ